MISWYIFTRFCITNINNIVKVDVDFNIKLFPKIVDGFIMPDTSFIPRSIRYEVLEMFLWPGVIGGLEVPSSQNLLCFLAFE